MPTRDSTSVRTSRAAPKSAFNGALTSTLLTLPLASSSLLAQGNRIEVTPPDGNSRIEEMWAAPGMLQNPVAITFDSDGALYIAETDRAGNAVTDTRHLEHLNAIEEDLKLRSVEDRRALIERWIEGGHFEPDHFTRTEDRVRVLRDTDGDGVADESAVFAGGFNDSVDGIASGLLWVDDTLYFTNIPHLWALRDTDSDGVADEREQLSSGYGVRWCFYGHDLHGLILGPDGRLYFSLGDRGYNVLTPEGERLVGVDRGAVFRCWPDGSGLELFYDGLRNPQELAFDEFGNLFTGDNNSDSGDKARVIHIVEGGDSGWRQNVQSLPSRGPWNRERMWNLVGEENANLTSPTRPAWSLPPIAHVTAGPSGFSHYPGTGESETYDDQFFLVDFYGSGATLHTFRLEPDGAWFELQDKGVYYKGKTVTVIAWGLDGRLYLSDWGGGWEPNPKGNVFTITNQTVREDPAQLAAIEEVRALIQGGLAEATSEQLLELLHHRDQRIRQGAQQRLAKDSSTSPTLAALAADAEAPLLARVHAIWTIGQHARSSPDLAAPLTDLINDQDPQIRIQSTKLLADLRIDLPEKYLTLLSDPNPQVCFYAALALGMTGHVPAQLSLLELLERSGDTDPILRHGAAYAIALINRPDELIDIATTRSAPARLGAVVALRRMKSPAVSAFLHDPDPRVAIESARAIYDLYIDEALPSLAALIEGVPPDRRIEPLMRRTIEANVLLGTSEAADRLAAFAASEAAEDTWRTLALQRLDGWDEPLKREGVWGDWVDLPARDSAAVSAAVAPHIDQIRDRATGEEAETLAASLASRLTLDVPVEEAMAMLAAPDRDAASRRTILEQIARDHPDRTQEACDLVLASDGPPALRMRTRELMLAAAPQRGVELLRDALDARSLDERQHAAGALLSTDSPLAADIASDLRGRLSAGSIDPAIALEVAVATGESNLERTEWLAEGGNPVRGRNIFFQHASAQCVRCHAVDGKGGIAGPDMSDAGLRLTTEQIIESMTEPAATIADGYGTVSLMLAGGGFVSGPLVRESPSAVTLMLAGEERTYQNFQIRERSGPVSAMPDMSSLLSPREIRDVVAYLETLQAEPPARTVSQSSSAASTTTTRRGLGLAGGLVVIAGAFLLIVGIPLVILIKRNYN
jgi:quinoprotein glucose dehydrogenase